MMIHDYGNQSNKGRRVLCFWKPLEWFLFGFSTPVLMRQSNNENQDKWQPCKPVKIKFGRCHHGFEKRSLSHPFLFHFPQLSGEFRMGGSKQQDE